MHVSATSIQAHTFLHFPLYWILLPFPSTETKAS